MIGWDKETVWGEALAVDCTASDVCDCVLSKNSRLLFPFFKMVLGTQSLLLMD